MLVRDMPRLEASVCRYLVTAYLAFVDVSFSTDRPDPAYAGSGATFLRSPIEAYGFFAFGLRFKSWHLRDRKGGVSHEITTGLRAVVPIREKFQNPEV